MKTVKYQKINLKKQSINIKIFNCWIFKQ